MTTVEPTPGRSVTLVLCRRDGSLVGALPPFQVDVPWWQEVGPVVDGARAHHDVTVTVLRLLEAEPDRAGHGAGGPVTYLAEVDDDTTGATARWDGPPIVDEPLRLPWARPGGPAADLAWADAVLAARGTPRAGAARQVRTWNLSSLWRVPLAEGAAWLKVVPPFFAHEGAVLSRLDTPAVPVVLAADGPRVLLDELPGADQYDADGRVLHRMVELLVDLQARWIERTDELLALGAPDWRAAPLAELVAALVDGSSPRLEPAASAALATLVTGLPARFEALAGCGLPDTLVHGDFHRGNVRADGDRLWLLDWGDCGLGHPMLDQAAFLDRMPAHEVERVRRTWSATWRARIPGCDPDRATELLAPVAALRQALIYQVFLDGIEPSERIYHAGDPVHWLERAAAIA